VNIDVIAVDCVFVNSYKMMDLVHCFLVIPTSRQFQNLLQLRLQIFRGVKIS